MKKIAQVTTLLFFTMSLCGCGVSFFADEKVDSTFKELEKVDFDIDISHITDQKVTIEEVDPEGEVATALANVNEVESWSFKASIVEKMDNINKSLKEAKKEVMKLNQWYCNKGKTSDACYKLSNINNVITLYYYQYFEDEYVSYNKMIVTTAEDGTKKVDNYFNVARLSNEYHNYKEYISFTEDKEYEYVHYINDMDSLVAYHSINNEGYWETIELSETEKEDFDITTHVKGTQGYYYTYWTVNKDKANYNEFEVKNIPNKKSILNIYPINLDTTGHIASKVIYLEYNRDILENIIAFLSTGFESYWNNNPDKEAAYATFNIVTKTGILKHGYQVDSCAFAGAYTDKTKVMFECKQNGLASAVTSIKKILDEYNIGLRFALDGAEIEQMINRVPNIADNLSIYNIQELTKYDSIDSLKQKLNAELLILTDFIDMPRE